MNQYIESILLGFVEGLTEFIPVSSTGHLILVEALLNRDHNSAGVFDVFIQIGAILAVVWARRMRIVQLLSGMFSNPSEQMFIAKIGVAFLPAALAGVLLHSFIKSVLFSPWVVGFSLIVGGVFMLFAEKISRPAQIQNIETLPVRTALGIGLCQVLSLVPGVSRAGASIVGARMLGVEMRTAAEFSFYLAIPTIFGAAAFDLYKSWDMISAKDIPSFAVGTIAAFLSALIVVNALINFVGKYGFKPFGYYRIVLGLVVLGLLYTGIVTTS